jgi:hypothetical protein
MWHYATFLVAIVSLENLKTNHRGKKTTLPGIPLTQQQDSHPPTLYTAQCICEGDVHKGKLESPVYNKKTSLKYETSILSLLPPVSYVHS